MVRRALALFIPFLLAACASLSKGGQNVFVVGSDEAVRGCKALGDVHARSSLRGIASFLAASERVEIELRNKVARKGGDRLLLEWKETPINEDSYAFGKAYDCR